jgi:hypothetical protein
LPGGLRAVGGFQTFGRINLSVTDGGNSYFALIYRMCLSPMTALGFVFKDPRANLKDPIGADTNWPWVKSGKYAAVN